MTVLAVFRAAWGLLRSPLGKVLALVAVAVLALSWADARAFRRGVSVTEAKWQAQLAESASKARKVEAKNEAKSAEVGKSVAVKTAEHKARTAYLTREIPVYVPIDPGRASLSVGFVRLHDAAALGLPPAPDSAGRADATPSGVDDPALAETVIANYGQCHVWREQVIGWQSWARETGLAK